MIYLSLGLSFWLSLYIYVYMCIFLLSLSLSLSPLPEQSAWYQFARDTQCDISRFEKRVLFGVRMPTVLRTFLFVARITRPALNIKFERIDLHNYVPSDREEAENMTDIDTGAYLDPHSDQNILWFARAGRIYPVAFGLELCPPSQALQREYRGVLKRCHCQCRGLSQPAGSGNSEELEHAPCCKSYDHCHPVTRVRAHTTPSTSATARQPQYRLETRDIDHGDDDDDDVTTVPAVVHRGRWRQSVMRLLQTARKRGRERTTSEARTVDVGCGYPLVSIDDCPIVYAHPRVGAVGYAWRNTADFFRRGVADFEENREGAALMAWLASHGW